MDLLVENSRDFDTAARYSGDEFALVLPGSSVGRRLRRGRADSRRPRRPRRTLSLASRRSLHADDVVSLVQAADEALFESKRARRNRVTASQRRGGTLRAVATQ